jgi:hypothetical protein
VDISEELVAVDYYELSVGSVSINSKEEAA